MALSDGNVIALLRIATYVVHSRLARDIGARLPRLAKVAWQAKARQGFEPGSESTSQGCGAGTLKPDGFSHGAVLGPGSGDEWARRSFNEMRVEVASGLRQWMNDEFASLDPDEPDNREPCLAGPLFRACKRLSRVHFSPGTIGLAYNHYCTPAGQQAWM